MSLHLRTGHNDVDRAVGSYGRGTAAASAATPRGLPDHAAAEHEAEVFASRFQHEFVGYDGSALCDEPHVSELWISHLRGKQTSGSVFSTKYMRSD